MIALVGKFGFHGEPTINNGQPGLVARDLVSDVLVDIQYGRAADPFGWVYTIRPMAQINRSRLVQPG